jgi:putative ABC transport system permease protein
VLRRAPGFSATVILTLALGIGGNAAIFGLVNTLYFAPLPIPSPDRVLRLNDSAPGAGGDRRLFGMHSQNVAEVAAHPELFSGVVALFGADLAMTGSDAAERVTVIARTAGWRETLAVTPVLGRDFSEDEQRRGAASGVALVSEALWRRKFPGAQPGTAVLHVDNRPFVLVGVMPPGFRFPYEADVWIPHVVDPANHARDYAVFARLAPGVTLEQVRAALDPISAGLRARYPDEIPGYAIAARLLRDNLIDNEAGSSLALLSLVGFLLLLACVNVATLLLARSVSRGREFALRAVLGASRLRQFRQAAAETLVFAILGGGLGFALAAWMAPLTATLLPSNLSVQLGMSAPRMDIRVVGVTALLSFVAAILAAGLPALAGVRRNTAVTVREGGRGTVADSPRRRRLLGGFVAGQVALALVLLAGSAAMLQNLRALQHRELGVDAEGLLTFVLTPSRAAYPDGTARAALVRRLTDDLAALPGVTAAGMTTVNPFGGSSWGASVVVEGRDTGRDADAIQINHRLVTPGTFRAMGIPVLRGRDIAWTDDSDHPGVAVVSARMAARLWPGQDPIGRRIRNGRAGSPWLTVVGVVGDVADARDPSDPDMTWYLPYVQMAASPSADDLHAMLRSRADVLAAARQRIASVDPMLALYDVAMMDDYYAGTLDRDRFGAGLMAIFGGFGLLLAALGVYGVMAFTVAQRVPEIGVRMALGADTRAVLGLIVLGGLRVAVAGLAIGCVLALVVRRALAAFLPAVPPNDAAAAVTAACVLFLALVVACVAPAMRAARVSPLEALRRGEA